jgi:flagellar FliL protein
MAVAEENKDSKETKEKDEKESGAEGESEGGSGASEGSPEADPAAAAKKRKKTLLLILLVVVIAIAGAGAVAYIKFGKKADESTAAAEGAEKTPKKKEPTFVDLDEMIVNLNTEGKNVSFMKLRVTLEVEGKDNADTIVKLMPRVKDVLQVYLRELRPSDMEGSVGLYRLREELLLRINKVIYPAEVRDILFKEVLVQ